MNGRVEPSARENNVSGAVVDASYEVHKALGNGLLESVYEIALAHELAERGFTVRRQVAIPVRFKGIIFEEGFRADLVVENMVLVELKSVEQISASHKKQLLTYLRLTGYKLGLLINFGSPLLRTGIHRVVNGAMS